MADSSHSKVSIVGLFAVLSFILTIPLVVLLSQEQQDYRGRAAEEPTATPQLFPPSPASGSLSGYIYYDKNKNGEREKEELPFPGTTIRIRLIKHSTSAEKSQPASTESVLITDSNGYFNFKFFNRFPGTKFIVKLDLPNGYKTINTNPVIFSDFRDVQEIVSFGLFPLAEIDKLPLPSITISACTPPPACLYSTPRCLLPEPKGGWCVKIPANPYDSSPSGQFTNR